MQTRYKGYTGRALKIDLTKRTFEDYEISDRDRELYLGGRAMAAKIISGFVKERIDAFSEENMIVISTGPLTGSGAPSSSRFEISSISPLTGILGSSNCGGNFGLHLKRAGYDALIICGRAKEPVYLRIDDDTVSFEAADKLWGMKTTEAQEALGAKRGNIVIGPAGEHLVRYAGVFCQQRAAGRTGIGAVFGSKNLKAVTVKGSKQVEVFDREKLKKHCEKWIKTLKKHPVTGRQLPKRGTAALLKMMQENSQLATKNYSAGTFDGWETISGEYMRETRLLRNDGCVTCPIRCARIVEYDGKEIKGPELETLGLLGSNLLNPKLEKIIEWNYLLDEMGMDTMSFGGTLGFAMELSEKGLWDNGLEFGKTDGISKLIEDIAYRRGIGGKLAEGVRALSLEFGGKEFAINAKGLELAAYEPRGAVGMGLGYATGNRGGCHLNGGYLMILEGLGMKMDRYTTLSKAQFSVMFQNAMQGVSSGGNCLFTTYAMFPGFLMDGKPRLAARIVFKVMKYAGPIVGIINRFPMLFNINVPILPHTKAIALATGMKMSFGRLLRIGERAYNLERKINSAFGISGSADELPARLKQQQTAGNKRSLVPLAKLKKKYYRIRGWSRDGVQKERLLVKLKLTD